LFPKNFCALGYYLTRPNFLAEFYFSNLLVLLFRVKDRFGPFIDEVQRSMEPFIYYLA